MIKKEYDLNKLLSKSIIIATQQHMGQVDKSGSNYILHPLTVMNYVNTIEQKIIAVLHDAIEDTDLKPEELVEMGIPFYIVEKIKLLSRLGNESYDEFIERLSCDRDAIAVKMADLKHNMDLDRLEEIKSSDIKRYVKYKKAYKLLENKLELL